MKKEDDGLEQNYIESDEEKITVKREIDTNLGSIADSMTKCLRLQLDKNFLLYYNIKGDAG